MLSSAWSWASLGGLALLPFLTRGDLWTVTGRGGARRVADDRPRHGRGGTLDGLGGDERAGLTFTRHPGIAVSTFTSRWSCFSRVASTPSWSAAVLLSGPSRWVARRISLSPLAAGDGSERACDGCVPAPLPCPADAPQGRAGQRFDHAAAVAGLVGCCSYDNPYDVAPPRAFALAVFTTETSTGQPPVCTLVRRPAVLALVADWSRPGRVRPLRSRRAGFGLSPRALVVLTHDRIGVALTRAITGADGSMPSTGPPLPSGETVAARICRQRLGERVHLVRVHLPAPALRSLSALLADAIWGPRLSLDLI